MGDVPNFFKPDAQNGDGARYFDFPHQPTFKKPGSVPISCNGRPRIHLFFGDLVLRKFGKGDNESGNGNNDAP